MGPASPVRTPNLDRFARRGISCTRAYAPTPADIPARAALLTARWPWQNGVLADSEYGLLSRPDARVPRWSDALRRIGYQLGYVGKWEVSDQFDPLDCGFHDYVDESLYDLWRANMRLPARPAVGTTGGVDIGVNAAHSRLTWGADRVIESLQRYSRDAKPFFVRWDPSDPSLESVVPADLANAYSPQAIPAWPSFPDPLRNKPDIQDRSRIRAGVAHWTWEDWAPAVSRYFANIEHFDSLFGRIIDEVDNLGIAENTVVIYTARSGAMAGGHGMADFHGTMYEDVVRVPLIVRWPGLAGGVTYEGFILSALDIGTTLWQFSSDRPTGLSGQNLQQLFNRRNPARLAGYSVYSGGRSGLYSQRMVKTRDWKLVYNPGGRDEMYAADDAGELHNRVGDPVLREIESILRRLMWDTMQSARDPLANEGAVADLLG